MRILVDMTETALHGGNSGIQRVVRNVVSRSASLAAAVGVPVLPVVAIGKWLHAVPDPVAVGPVRPAVQPSLAAGEPAPTPRFRQALGCAVERLPATRAALRRWRQRQLYRHPRSQHLPRLTLEQGDVYLLLDSFCGCSTVVTALTAAHARGARTVAVIYDLIPVTHPHFCAERVVTDFGRDCPRVLVQADAIMAISATVARQVETYAAEAVPGWYRRRCPVSFFHLGADFTAPGFTDALPREWQGWPPGLWGGEPVFLMLGTLEPRKGHAFVLDAFERAWCAGSREKLLLVGQMGWKMADLQERLRTSPYLGQSLFVVTAAPDVAVAEAIRRSRAGIVASSAEGFGLPLVEFMQMGLPVLASDIPVFREVGGDYPVYFSLDRPEALRNAVDQFYRREAEIRQKLAGFRWLSWDEAALALVRQVVSLTA